MKRDEEILREAKRHYYDDINCHNAFLHGVEWADEHPANVWHEASEEPKCGKAILCLNKKGSINLLTNNNKLIYTLAQMDAGVDKWAYINDLLPKQFGNSKQVKGGEQ